MSTTTKPLTVEQTKALLINAYGFEDKHGILYTCHSTLIEDNNTATIVASDPDSQDAYIISLTDASLDGCTLVVNEDDGPVVRFTVLVPLTLTDVDSMLEQGKRDF
jgi:hypothetical protein